MIDVKAAGHCYRADRWLFRDLSFQVQPGEILAVLGPNGRGKSTLLRSICGTLIPREGHVRIEGAVGYVAQAQQVDVAFDVIDMVLMGRSRFLGRFQSPGAADIAVAKSCLDAVGMSAVTHQRYDRLSGGQRQLVLLARALATECSVLVLDEPASALDLANQGGVLRLLLRLTVERNLAVLFTTHDPAHALGIADHALLLFEHAQHACGTADATLNEENLSRLYNMQVRRSRWSYDGDQGEVIIPLHGLRQGGVVFS